MRSATSQKTPKPNPNPKKEIRLGRISTRIIHYLSDKLLSSGRMRDELVRQSTRTFDKATVMST